MLNDPRSSLQPDLSERRHSCPLCHSDGVIRRIYNSSDKYQKLIGIFDDVRVWYICPSCRLHWQTNCLTYTDLQNIYDHYRDTSFRNESLKDIFLRVNSLEPEESENYYRYQWFSKHIGMDTGTVLDIGSGFGIWPYELSKHGWEVHCIEPNEESSKFINEYLKIPCSNSYGLEVCNKTYDVVSLIHVLEHIDRPLELLNGIKKVLNPGGYLFVEVPDGVEFKHLAADHDEFNSTHLFFYDTGSLFNLLNRVFYVKDIHRVHYKSRGLYRIFALCQME